MVPPVACVSKDISARRLGVNALGYRCLRVGNKSNPPDLWDAMTFSSIYHAVSAIWSFMDVHGEARATQSESIQRRTLKLETTA